jgi:hypothetical protein
VDRILERYLMMETDSRAEFAARQRALSERGETDRFNITLDPFMHPKNTSELMVPR